MVISGLQDITGLRRAEEALSASEQRFRALIQNIADIVSVLDRRGHQVQQSLGLRFWATMKMRCSDAGLDNVHPDDAARVRTVRPVGRPGSRLRYECRGRHKDGHYLVVGRW